MGLNQPFQNILPRWWMKYFYSYLLYLKSQRRYWYGSLWSQFLKTVLTYLEAIIYLIISMQPKTSQRFTTQMPFTAHPPHHQIQGTRKNICRGMGWRSEGWTHTWTSCFVVFLSAAGKRCLAASHFSLLVEPKYFLPRNSRMAKTELEVDGLPQKHELVEVAKDRVSDLIIIWMEVNRKSWRLTDIQFRRSRILGTAYRVSDRCRGKWDRAGRHLVSRQWSYYIKR